MTAGCASDGSERSFSSCKTMSCQSANALQKELPKPKKIALILVRVRNACMLQKVLVKIDLRLIFVLMFRSWVLWAKAMV